MKDIQIKERFVELRAEGKSFSEIAVAIGVSKPTLVAWSRELEIEISNLRSIAWEALCQKYFVAKEKRVALFGRLLARLAGEIEKRDLTDVETAKLFELMLKYAAALKSDETLLEFKGMAPTFEVEFEKETSWSA